MKTRKTLLFIFLSAIIAIAPVTNWSIDQNLVRGIVWRLTMIVTFGIGYFWPRKKNRINNDLTFNIH